MRPHTPGPWRIGKGYDAVVSDTPPNPRLSSSLDAEEVAAYGGYIIAESITKNNKPLIAMAPQILEACEDAVTILSACTEVQDPRTVQGLVWQANLRLKYALDELEGLEHEVTE